MISVHILKEEKKRNNKIYDLKIFTLFLRPKPTNRIYKVNEFEVVTFLVVYVHQIFIPFVSIVACKHKKYVLKLFIHEALCSKKSFIGFNGLI